MSLANTRGVQEHTQMNLEDFKMVKNSKSKEIGYIKCSYKDTSWKSCEAWQKSSPEIISQWNSMLPSKIAWKTNF